MKNIWCTKWEVDFVLDGVVRSEYFVGREWKDVLKEFNKTYNGREHTVEILGKRIVGGDGEGG